jgi:hypothetical protein
LHINTFTEQRKGMMKQALTCLSARQHTVLIWSSPTMDVVPKSQRNIKVKEKQKELAKVVEGLKH